MVMRSAPACFCAKLQGRSRPAWADYDGDGRLDLGAVGQAIGRQGQAQLVEFLGQALGD